MDLESVKGYTAGLVCEGIFTKDNSGEKRFPQRWLHLLVGVRCEEIQGESNASYLRSRALSKYIY